MPKLDAAVCAKVQEQNTRYALLAYLDTVLVFWKYFKQSAGPDSDLTKARLCKRIIKITPALDLPILGVDYIRLVQEHFPDLYDQQDVLLTTFDHLLRHLHSWSLEQILTALQGFPADLYTPKIYNVLAAEFYQKVFSLPHPQAEELLHTNQHIFATSAQISEFLTCTPQQPTISRNSRCSCLFF